MGRNVVLMVALLALPVLGGCTDIRTLKPESELTRPSETVRVLLMEPDIELYEITFAGLPEPRAEWTEVAKTNANAALTALLGEKNAVLVPYRPPEDPARARAHSRLIKLHRAVGTSILRHMLAPGESLPTKKDKFDWTLGDGVAMLREEYNADYALFVHIRDSYSSDGRKTLMVLAALLGRLVPGGEQQGFASLVDLRSGDVVWFNVLQSAFGDLRSPPEARNACEKLLSEFPL